MEIEQKERDRIEAETERFLNMGFLQCVLSLIMKIVFLLLSGLYKF